MQLLSWVSIMSIEDFYKSGWKVQRRANTAKVDDGGALTGDDWADHLAISARIRLLSGNETRIYDKEQGASTHRVCTAVADILNTDRLVDPDGKTYAILYVNNVDQLDHHLEIDCKEPEFGS